MCSDVPERPPAGYAPYKRTPDFTADTIPEGLRRAHQTKAGVWAVIHVTEGALRFRQEAPAREKTIAAGETLACPPEAVHEVAPAGAVSFYVEFWRA